MIHLEVNLCSNRMARRSNMYSFGMLGPQSQVIVGQWPGNSTSKNEKCILPHSKATVARLLA